MTNLASVFPTANLFRELSGYSTQTTTTNKYISEDSLTKYYVTWRIATQNYFSQNTLFLLNRKGLSQQVLELSETKISRRAIRARGWIQRLTQRLDKQLIGSRNNQIPNYIIHGWVHNNECGKSNGRETRTQTIQWIWIRRRHPPLCQPMSQLSHAAVRVWRHFTWTNCLENYNKRRLLGSYRSLTYLHR